MKPPPYFEAIRDESERLWRQLEGHPDLAGPWRMLFEQVKDPRHLLSELFQNADDAGAGRVEVRLTDEALEVRHDGRDFTESDLRTLCRFARSNKRTLATIGFRGIGFKSVFAAGPTVALTTPTLSLRFEEQRFTSPIWEGHPGADNEVVVRVAWRSDSARLAVAESLERWKSSPAGLLFFRSVRELRFDGLTVRRTRIGDGPLPESEDFGLEREADGEERQDQLVTIFRSRAMALPDDCRREIEDARRSEGDLGEADVHVEIVLGLQDPQCLHSVLPTDATWAFRFSCNAPFMLTPDRSRLRDPSDSPTNRWLLGESGRLAAHALAGWVRDQSRSLENRARAYALLPADDQVSHPLGAEAATIVRASFEAEIHAAKLRMLLCVDGLCRTTDNACFVPPELLSAWGPEVTMAILGLSGQIPVSPVIASANRVRLERLSLLRRAAPTECIRILRQRTALPRPATWAGLADLWTFVSVAGDEAASGGRSVQVAESAFLGFAVFPVAGQHLLQRASGIVRAPWRPEDLSEDAWNEVLALIRVLDPGWVSWIHEESQTGQAQSRAAAKCRRILEQVNLVSPPEMQVVFERSADVLFDGAGNEERVIRVSRLLAKLNLRTPRNWRWLNGKGDRRPVGAPTLSGVGGREDLIPEEWLENHAISPGYFSETAPAFTSWARSDRSGLLPFVLPNRVQNPGLLGVEAAEAWARERGGERLGFMSFSRVRFEIEDWDFEESLWGYWEALCQQNQQVFRRLLGAILALPAGELQSRAKARIFAVGRGASRRALDVDCRARWVERFRSEEWLPDEFGRPARPEELYRRTRDTEALVGVERFVHPELDQPPAAEILDLLGVRTRGHSADGLLDRVERAAGLANPGLSDQLVREVGRWLVALDRYLAAAESSELQTVRARFEQRALLPDADGIPRRSHDLVRTNKEGLPVPVVHPALDVPMLWERVGIKIQPSEEDLLSFLEGIGEGHQLTGVDLERVRLILTGAPSRALHRTGRWLDAGGTMRAWASFRFSMVERGEGSRLLLPALRAKVADLTMLSSELANTGEFGVLPRLEADLELRMSRGSARDEWDCAEPLPAVGRMLAALCAREDLGLTGLRLLAERLASLDRLPIFDDLRAAPFIGGEQVGEEIPVLAAWKGRDLCLAGQHLAVRGRGLGSFLEEQVLAAAGDAPSVRDLARDVAYCVGRPERMAVDLFRERWGADLVAGSNEQGGCSGVGPERGDDLIAGPSLPGPNSPRPDGDGAGTPPGDGGTPHSGANPALPPPPKDSVETRLAKALGFEKVGDGYMNRNRDEVLVDLGKDQPLRWGVRRPATGYLLRRICVVELSRPGRGEISGEAWEALKGAGPHWMALVDRTSAHVEMLPAGELEQRVKRGEITVHVAHYRLNLRSRRAALGNSEEVEK